jgi:RNA polymerase sigma-70 factor (ECF subfamily)
MNQRTAPLAWQGYIVDKADDEPLEDELQAALAGNDPAAVEWIWNRYASDLLAFLRAVLCSGHDAEDVLQMVFLRIVRKRHKLAKARDLDAYVYRIARNAAVDLLGRRKKEQIARTTSEPWLIRRDTGSQSTSCELVEKLQTALARLPQPQREVIVMKIYRQKTFMEISKLLGLSQNTAASRYRYGLRKLRTLLGNPR